MEIKICPLCNSAIKPISINNFNEINCPSCHKFSFSLEMYKDYLEQDKIDNELKKVLADYYKLESDNLRVLNSNNLISIILRNFFSLSDKDKRWLLREIDNLLDKKMEKYHIPTRDIFNAKLSNFYAEKKDPLLTAVIGEIGNNTFDHNLQWQGFNGLYYNIDIPGYVLLIDQGQGLKSSLSKVVQSLNTDKEALECAFLQKISGRSPERRGNGLKFVLKSIIDQKWKLYFQSGNGYCNIKGNKPSFNEYSLLNLKGCLAIINYNQGKN